MSFDIFNPFPKSPQAAKANLWDEVFAKRLRGGVPVRRPVAPEAEPDDPAPVEAAAEPAPDAKPEIKLFNPRWGGKLGAFNQKMTMSVEGALPPPGDSPCPGPSAGSWEIPICFSRQIQKAGWNCPSMKASPAWKSSGKTGMWSKFVPGRLAGSKPAGPAVRAAGKEGSVVAMATPIIAGYLHGPAVDKRFDVVVWRKRLREASDRKKPGETLEVEWDVGTRERDVFGRQVIESREITYQKAGGRGCAEPPFPESRRRLTRIAALFPQSRAEPSQS